MSDRHSSIFSGEMTLHRAWEAWNCQKSTFVDSTIEPICNGAFHAKAIPRYRPVTGHFGRPRMSFDAARFSLTAIETHRLRGRNSRRAMVCRSDTEIPRPTRFQYTIAGNQPPPSRSRNSSRHRGARDNRLASDRASGPRHATRRIRESQRSLCQRRARSPLSRFCCFRSRCRRRLHVTANVTLYGIVDVGVQHVTGVRGGDHTSLASGIVEGSRWGLRGTEDIGVTATRRCLCLRAGLRLIPAVSAIVRCPARSCPGLPDRWSAARSAGRAHSAVGSQLGVSPARPPV